MISVGSRFPEFAVPACVSVEPGHEFRDVGSKDFAGKWLVLYTYPKDFTFVCPTEILEFDRLGADLGKRGAVLLGGSTDNEHAHLAWRNADPGLKKLTHPLIFVSPTLANALGVLHPTAGVAVRATFIVDPEGVVRYASFNDLDVGRSVSEVLRVLDALQTGELTACEWRPGERTLSSRAETTE